MTTYNQKIKQAVESYSIPGDKTAKEFGKVNVINDGRELQVEFTILFEPTGQDAEGWQTGVALDGSGSMKDWYGQRLLGQVPDQVLKTYQKKKWLLEFIQDGRKVKSFSPEAFQDAIKNKYLQQSQNIVEAEAKKFIGYLAGNLDAYSGTSVIYWACGDGSQIEELGLFPENKCANLTLAGPKHFGSDTTCLTPAVTYFANTFRNVKRGMYIFITDGKLDDLANVKKHTIQLAKEIEAGKRGFLKFILIGVGDDIDETQMEELDNLDTGTSIDLWDHKLAKEMKSIIEIFSEVVNENQIVASTGFIHDSTGNTVKKFTDGLPAKIEFTMPLNSRWFELEVSGRTIRQDIIFK